MTMIRVKREQWCWPMLLPSWCTRWVGGQISFSLFEILQGGGQPQSQHKTSGLRAFRLTSDAVWRIVNFLSPNQERAQEVRKSPKSFEQLEKEKAINKWKTSKVREFTHALILALHWGEIMKWVINCNCFHNRCSVFHVSLLPRPSLEFISDIFSEEF